MKIDEMNVVLVDDEPDFLEQAEIFLKKEDDRFIIESATTVEKALKIIDEKSIDAVVSDYRMPDEDGIEFLKTLREEKENDIPFLLFTGKGWEEVAMNALNLGANKYIWKNEEPSIYQQKSDESMSQYSLLADEIINEIKKHREKKRLELTKKTIEEAKSGIYWISPEGDILYANKFVRENLGYDEEEILELSISDIDPHFEEEKREETWQEIKEKGSITFETEQQKKDGTIFSVQITSNYVKKDDKEIEFAFVRETNQ